MMLIKPSPLETALPARDRRKTWSAPAVTSHALVVLTYDQLAVAPSGHSCSDETDLETLASAGGTVIDLTTVQKAWYDLLSDTLTVEYREDLDSRTLCVKFADAVAGDDCFTRLWRRLGAGFDLLPYKRDPWKAARIPLLVLFGILAATVFLGLTLSVLEDLAAARVAGPVSMPGPGEMAGPVMIPKSTLNEFLGWISWRTVCGFGGVTAALAQVWLYRRLTQPPVRLEVVRHPACPV